MTPQHQWTNGGAKVWLLKCVKADMTSYGGFVWPRSGPVRPSVFGRDATCESGGLFGWPWGFGIGDGMDINDPLGVWLVFAALPENILLVEEGPKAKFVPSEQEPSAEVLFAGAQADAVAFILSGQIAWIQAASATGNCGAASATGSYGAASAMGECGAASAMGSYGAASAMGSCGAASATGWKGAASATGSCGAASAMGECGAASATGNYGAASAMGECGAASATGECGAASATGWKGAASATGSCGAASATGSCGAASATESYGAASAMGECGAASATGWKGAASATGWKGAASATGSYGTASAMGPKGAALITGEKSTIEIGPQAVGVSTTRTFYWRVHVGAILLCRWNETGFRLLDSKALGLLEGALLTVVEGQIQ